jgi:hypothetical protein
MTDRSDSRAGPDARGHKRSYSIPCGSAFRDRILALAEARGVNAADLARAVILTLPAETVAAAPDPGGPGRDDRETVVLKSGPGKGKPWRRKPRLQVRLPAGFDPVTLRKALGIALDMAEGRWRVTLERPETPTRAEAQAHAEAAAARLRSAVAILCGEGLGHAVRTRDEALFILGFPPGSRPDIAALKTRYRQLATLHHPDSETGDTNRMAQLNQAIGFLRAYHK